MKKLIFSCLVLFLLQNIFINASFALDATTLIYPKNGTPFIPTQTNFEWEAVNGASSYIIQISELYDFSSISQEQETTRNLINVNLDIDKAYYWRVRSKNDAIISQWSEIFSFKTNIMNQSSGIIIGKSYQKQNRILSKSDLLIPYDNNFIQAMDRNDDISSASIPLQFTFNFYGKSYNSLYINNNGNISFEKPYYQYTPVGFPSNSYIMIAAFWADVDTRNISSGLVYYKSEPHRFTVIWDNVGYFSNHIDKYCTFELIITDGTDPIVGFNNSVCFSYDVMQWTTGDASKGSGGFGGSQATIGMNLGDGFNYSQVCRYNSSDVSQLDGKVYRFNLGFFSTAPVIELTDDTKTFLTTSSYAEGTQFNISAKITDIWYPGVQSATLYYKTVNNVNYSSAVMTKNGDIYSATIPSSVAKQFGVDFYIRATDGEQNSYSPTQDYLTRPWTISINPNVKPEVKIINEPVLTYSNLGHTIDVLADAKDNTNSLADVNLYYRVLGTEIYSKILMTASGNQDEFKANIPANVVTRSGLEIYVEAEDNYQVRNQTEVMQILFTSLITPILVSPQNNSTNISITPVFNWNTVTDANSYYIQISEDNSFSNLIISEDQLATNNYVVPSGKLTTNKTYYWRVRGRKGNEISSWSDVWNFSTIDNINLGLIAYYPFNGNSNDESGNGNNGTVNGATLCTDRFGNTNCAFYFDGIDDYIELINKSIAIQGNSDRSIFIWVKTSRNEECPISTGSASNSNDFNVAIGYLSGNGILGVMGYNDDFYPSSGTNISNNEWHLVGIIYKNQQLYIYIDTILDNSINMTFNTFGQNNYIGRSNHIGNEQWFFGFIDDIRIYNRALSFNELLQLESDTNTKLTSTILLNPSNYTNNVELLPTFIWSKNNNANNYRFQLSTDSLFLSSIINYFTTDTNYILTSNLLLSTKYYWRVKAYSSSDSSEWSNTWSFNTLSSSCTVTSPNTSETLYANKPYLITWQSSGIDNVMLEYTTNASSTSTSPSWTPITASTSATLGYYLWTIPDTPSSDCKVRISDASNSYTLDISDSVFTISPCYGYNEWTLYMQDNGKVPNNQINAIITEPTGTKWIATGNGLLKMTSSNSTTYSTSNSRLPDNQIICMAKDANYLWLGTYSGGVSRLDIASNTFTNFNNTSSPLPSNSINALAIESGTIWIGTDNGLASYDSNTWTIYRTQNAGMPDNNILDVKIDALGNKWIGTYAGLVKLNNSSSFTYTTSNSGLPNNIVRKIYIDNSNTLYIASGFDTGMTMFNGSTSWTQWLMSNSGIPSNFVTAIGIDNYGFKWIGTNKGIGIFDVSNWTYYNTTNSKLPSDIVLCFAFDYNDDKWMGTQGGLAKLGGCSQTFTLPPWTVKNQTGHNATIIVPKDCIISLCLFDKIENGDAIGVFYDDNGLLKCGGYSIYNANENIAITVWGDNDLTTEKDGFSSLEKYKLMIWDASKSEEKLATVIFKTGSNDYYYDDKVSEVQSIIAICNQFRINLFKDKKNLISSDYNPANSRIEDIMSGVLPQFKLMKNDQGFLYYPSYNINQINYWNMRNGYQVEMNNDATLIFNGSPIDPTNYPIELDAKKWYIIPYLAPTTFITTHALSSIWDNIFQLKDDDGNVVFLPWFFDKDIQYMYPFKGYKLSLISNDTLIYPKFAPASGALKGKVILSSNSKNILTKKYITNISGTGNTSILMIEGDNFSDYDEVGVFTSNNLLVGSGVVSNNLAVIKVWGDNSSTSAIEGATENEILKLKYWSSTENNEYSLYEKEITDVLLNKKISYTLKYNEDATYKVSVIKSINSVKNEIKQNQLSISNVPNPFTESTIFKYSIPKDGYVKITISNLLGNEIVTICDKWQPAGQYEVVFDSTNLENGMYIYKLSFDKELITNKMILMK